MSEQSTKGMTVNERLHHFGLFAAFDRAARTRDAAALIGVLLRAQFSQEQAEETARAFLDDPKRYGY